MTKHQYLQFASIWSLLAKCVLPQRAKKHRRCGTNSSGRMLMAMACPIVVSGITSGRWLSQNCGWGNNELSILYCQCDTLNARQKMACSSSNQEYRKTRVGLYSLHVWLAEKQAGRPATSRPGSNCQKAKAFGTNIRMLPGNGNMVDGRQVGEMDIMEFVGWPYSLSAHCRTSTSHMARWASHVRTRSWRCLFVYGMYWDNDVMYFYLDGRPYLELSTIRRVIPLALWSEFYRHFRILPLVATGASKAVNTSIWPQKMYVDYIRVLSESIKEQ